MATLRKIHVDDAAEIVDLDSSVYPVEDPVTADQLWAWYQNHPEFGMVYEQGGHTVGSCMVIAMTPAGWEKLIKNEISEATVGPDELFDANRGDSEIGLHIYHLERHGNSDGDFPGGLFRRVFKDLGALVARLPGGKSAVAIGGPRIVGISAYAVSSDGLRLFGQKLNFREREDMVSDEHILTRRSGEPAVEVVTVKSAAELQEALKARPGCTYQNRCQMLVLLPDEVSLAWLLMAEGGWAASPGQLEEVEKLQQPEKVIA